MSHHGIESAECLSGDLYVFGSAGRSMGGRHSANLRVGKSGFADDAFEHSRTAEAERPGLPRNGGWKLRALTDDRSRQRAPGISIGRRKDNDGDSAARSQCTAPLA